MDIADHIERLKTLSKFAAREAVQSVIVPAANELLAETKNRIILDGKATNDAQIGQYSTKPGYYSKEQFVRKGSFKPTGKKESSAYGTYSKSGKFIVPKRRTEKIGGKKVAVVKTEGFHAQERKSMYLPGGYKEFRNIQGRPIGKVNVNLSGDTMQRYQARRKSGSILFGMTTQKASNIRKGQEKKFGKRIYASTQTELDNYNKNVAQGFNQATIDILSGTGNTNI